MVKSDRMGQMSCKLLTMSIKEVYDIFKLGQRESGKLAQMPWCLS